MVSGSGDSDNISEPTTTFIYGGYRMKRYNNFLIVGIDHSYGNIKTANTVTPTGITKLDAAPTFTKNTL